MKRILKWLLILVLVSVVVAALTNDDESPPAPASEEEPPAATAPEQQVEPGVLVLSAEYGDRWPFTVDSGHADCVDGAAIFRTGGKSYQLTGLAKSRGYALIDPIWRDNPKIEGARIPLSEIIAIALEQCE